MLFAVCQPKPNNLKEGIKMANVNVTINHITPLIEERKKTTAYTKCRNLLDRAYAINAEQGLGTGTIWLQEQVSQMKSWIDLVPQGKDGVALELIYLGDGRISSKDEPLLDGEKMGAPLSEWLSNNECSVVMQQRRDVLIELLQKSSGKIVSLGSGPATVELNALMGNLDATLICVDLNDEALSRATELGSELGVSVKKIKENVFAGFDVSELEPREILSIGCVGNYLAGHMLTTVISRWLKSLKQGGRLITDYFAYNADVKKCLTEIVRWPVATEPEARGLRLYTCEEFVGFMTEAVTAAGCSANITVYDYLYGGVVEIVKN
jgi:hypothetical protein